MFCPKCGRKNSERNKFCNGCGAALPAVVAAPQFPAAPPPPPPKISNLPANSFADAELNKNEIGGLAASETVENVFPAAESVSDERIETAILTDGVNSERKEDSARISEADAAFSDDGFIGENSALESPEFFASETKARETDSSLKTPNANDFKDYFSEFADQRRVSEMPVETKKNFALIIAAAAAVALIIIGGFIALEWRFAGQNGQPAEIVSPNKSPVIVEKTSNQTSAEMVYVSGGEFMMGSDGGDEYERPAHRISVKPFYIDKTEITCEEYKKFVDATNYKPPANWQNSAFPGVSALKPVTGINWDDANAYAKWKGKRLPTEEEWEFAARGADARIYPWGNEWQPPLANADKQKDAVQAVGAFGGQSPFGCFDMSGNAWEWTSSTAQAYPNGKAFETQSIEPKILRGGYFGTPKELATTTLRRPYGARNEAKGYGNTGFRCVLDISENGAEKSGEKIK